MVGVLLWEFEASGLVGVRLQVTLNRECDGLGYYDASTTAACPWANHLTKEYLFQSQTQLAGIFNRARASQLRMGP